MQKLGCVYTCIIGFTALLLLSGCATSQPGLRVDVGPIYSSTPDIARNQGFQALGPLVEARKSPVGHTFAAVRPFWSKTVDPGEDRSIQDILWPLGMFKMRKDELDWRFLISFGHDFDQTDDPSRHRWSVFPLLFGGRDKTGVPYFSIFPLGGTLREFIGRERIFFVLFPLYAESQQADNYTTSILWPIYSRTIGNDIFRWRVWPFYGYSHSKERWTKRFIFWPFYTSVDYHYPDLEGQGFVLFPFYGQIVLPDRSSRLFLPPFFKVESGKDHFAFNAPWPFLQYVQNPREKKFYVFPLWGRKALPHMSEWFAVWPLISKRTADRPREIYRRFRIFPFWYHEKIISRSRTQEAADTDPAMQRESGADSANTADCTRRFFRFWPLAMFRREEDHRLLRVPALWPSRQVPAIERNWAPLWTLYQSERKGERNETEFLWGLVRLTKDEDRSAMHVFPLYDAKKQGGHRSWRFLYGLLGRERDALQTSWQLLYFLHIRSERQPEDVPQ